MNISQTGLELIKEFEGVRLEAYPDPATGGDPWTIGVGHTGPEVRPGMVITQERCNEILRADLKRFELCVNACVHVPVTQNQFDAMVAFAFNVGCQNFKTSTLLRKLNEGDDTGASEQFQRWDKANGKVMLGLVRRREAEMALFLS